MLFLGYSSSPGPLLQPVYSGCRLESPSRCPSYLSSPTPGSRRVPGRILSLLCVAGTPPRECGACPFGGVPPRFHARFSGSLGMAALSSQEGFH